jgi:hypothetical protein
MSAAVNIVLLSGGLTFTNEWYQTRKADWKVPVATLVLAAAAGGIANVDKSAGAFFAGLIFLGAVTTKFNGKSVINLVTDFAGTTQGKT